MLSSWSAVRDPPQGGAYSSWFHDETKPGWPGGSGGSPGFDLKTCHFPYRQGVRPSGPSGEPRNGGTSSFTPPPVEGSSTIHVVLGSTEVGLIAITVSVRLRLSGSAARRWRLPHQARLPASRRRPCRSAVLSRGGDGPWRASPAGLCLSARRSSAARPRQRGRAWSGQGALSACPRSVPRSRRRSRSFCPGVYRFHRSDDRSR